MPRLPTPGSDTGQWGTILNDFLAKSHDANGNLNPGIVTATNIQDGTITSVKLNSEAQASLTKAEGSLQISNNLSEIAASAAAVRANLGVPATSHAHTLANITDVSSLDAAYVQRSGELTTLDIGTIEAKYGSGFFFKGVNLGYSTNSGQARSDATFILDYSWEWITDSIDKIAAMGANTTRVMGGYFAYVLDPVLFKQRVHATWDYAHSKGLRFVWSFADSPDLPADAAKIAQIKAMITDMIDGYQDNPYMIWDPGNELGNSAVAIELAQYIRATGTTCLITSSGDGTQTWMYELDPYVDFHDFHFYVDPGINATATYFEAYRARTKKPILIGETGTNSDAAGNAPIITDAYQRALYLRHLLVFAARGDICGILVWKIKDPNPATVHKFGLYETDGTPTPQIPAVLDIPDRRMTVVQTAIDLRNTPIVLDNFARANSATQVGGPLIGSAPTAASGTWGISNKKGYLAVTSGTGLNHLVWEANSCDAVVEMEFTPASGSIIGVIFRFIDTSNYYFWRWQASNNSVSLKKVVAGVTTNITPANLWARSTTTGSDITGISVSSHGRLSARVRDTGIVVTLNGRTWSTVDDTAALATATKYGILYGDGDNGSRVRKFSVSVPARYW